MGLIDLSEADLLLTPNDCDDSITHILRLLYLRRISDLRGDAFIYKVLILSSIREFQLGTDIHCLDACEYKSDSTAGFFV